MYSVERHDRAFLSTSPCVTWPVKQDVLGVHVSVTSYAEVTDVVIRAATNQTPAIVDFSPVDIIMQAAHNPRFLSKLNAFDLVCPDGQPVRWWLNHFRAAGLTDRVCGTTTMLRLCEAAAGLAVPIYLYGSTQQTLAGLTARLMELYPQLTIAGSESPPFRPLTPQEDLEVIGRINSSGAALVFVGIGSPKQENFAWEHKKTLRAVQLCVGAAFDFIAGSKRRAPGWMQRVGLEWLFRLCSEPTRLGRRYFVTNTRFLTAVLAETVHRLAHEHL
jgi:N-acetylglucosaminyldiphosphoundecaprenol N-acetyl-beta-D-mannosaminyltransferase